MKKVITISREFGSGGSEIARKLSEKLGVKYVDKDILNEAASQSGIAKEHFENADEKRTNSFLFSLVTAHYGGAAAPIQFNDIITDDKLFIYTSDAIKKFASEPCVIVGRCADDILRDYDKISLFICADMQDKIKRISALYNLNEKSAATLIKKTDKKRANYYNFYTSKTWGDANNYDLSINTSRLGIDKTVNALVGFIRAFDETN